MPNIRFSAWFILLSVFIGFASPVSAQQNLPEIFEDIFKTDKKTAPFGGANGLVYIENIPVTVTFDTRADLLPPEATLIITAIAPPPAHIRRAKPLIIGETRLLISRLAPPLQMVVAVPSDMARELDYAQIQARIVDVNGVTRHELREAVRYSGGQPPLLNLIPEGALDQPVYSPGRPSQADPQTPSQHGHDTISGQVRLNDDRPIMRGAKLIVRVSETTLAGGMSGNIVTEQEIDIDQQTAPFNFTERLPRRNGKTLENPEIEAWIIDWAGRKTHIMRAPTPFSTQVTNGTIPVTLYLDSLVTGIDAIEPDPVLEPAPDQIYTPDGAIRTVTGEAKIEAPRGLPSGTSLIITVQDATNTSRVIKRSVLPLDGLSGDVPFSFDLDNRNINTNGVEPLISAVIDTREGNTLLSTQSLSVLGRAPVTLNLRPTALY